MLDHLARVRRPVRGRAPELAGVRVAGGPAPITGIALSKPPWRAHLDTVEFLKEREILGRHVYVVGFAADHVRAGRVEMSMVVRAERVGSGWVARGIGAGTTIGEPHLTEPRVYLAGSWGRFGFCGGGKVYPAGKTISSVRLRFEKGIELEDDTESGWVVFFVDQPVERPDATVEMLGPDGGVVASHGWPPGPDLPDELRRRIRSD